MQIQLKPGPNSSKEAHRTVAPEPPMLAAPRNLHITVVSSSGTKEYNIKNTHNCKSDPPIMRNNFPGQLHCMDIPSHSARMHCAGYQSISTIPTTQQTATRELSHPRTSIVSIHNSLETSHSLSHFLNVSLGDPETSQCLRFQTQHRSGKKQQSYSLLRFLEGGIDDPWTSECPAIITPPVVERDLDEVEQLSGSRAGRIFDGGGESIFEAGRTDINLEDGIKTSVGPES
ncbi:hypothetical protein EV426DRAFT_577647 [Tirmania nivea]|nr:hypothetical protein EV426DRAFT_577647 [Tirmania nivea]